MLPGVRVLSLATVTFPIFAFVAAEAHTVASGIASLNSWQGCAWDPAAITAENAGDHPLIFKLWVLRCLKCRQGLLNNLFSGQWQPPKVRVARPDCCWPPEPCLPWQSASPAISRQGEAKQFKRRPIIEQETYAVQCCTQHYTTIHDLYALDCAMLCRLQEFFPLVGFCIAVPSFSSVDEPRWAQGKHVKTPKISWVSWISFRKDLALFVTSIFWGPRCWHSFMAVSLSSSSACSVRWVFELGLSDVFCVPVIPSACQADPRPARPSACRTPSSSRRRPSSKGVGAADFALVTSVLVILVRHGAKPVPKRKCFWQGRQQVPWFAFEVFGAASAIPGNFCKSQRQTQLLSWETLHVRQMKPQVSDSRVHSPLRTITYNLISLELIAMWV